MVKPSLTITRLGSAFLGAALSLAVGGVIAANVAALLLGLSGILIVGFCRLAAPRALINSAVELHTPRHLSAHSPFTAELTIQNNNRLLDIWHAQITIALPDGKSLEAVAPWTPAGSASVIKKSLMISSRSVIKNVTANISSSFPLGLFRVERELSIGRDLTVTPRLITPIEFTQRYDKRDSTQARQIPTAGQAMNEPRGLREWQSGDAVKSIHWPSSARSMQMGKGLNVRTYDPPNHDPIHCDIVFHSYSAQREMIIADNFERSISLLAGAMSYLQSHSTTCRITADFMGWETIECSSRKSLIDSLKALSLAKRAPYTEAHELEDILQNLSSTGSHQTKGLIIISDMTPDSWAHLVSQYPQLLIIDIRQIRYDIRLQYQQKVS